MKDVIPDFVQRMINNKKENQVSRSRQERFPNFNFSMHRIIFHKA